MWILSETVFEKSASVDIIRVSAGVTVTVESKQQTWTKQSLPQRYLCVGCQLNSDQALRSPCLKVHFRARGSTLRRYRLQEATEFLYTETPLLEGVEQPKISSKNPGNALSDTLLMSRFQILCAVFLKPCFAVLVNLLVRINSGPKILTAAVSPRTRRTSQRSSY